MVTHDTWEELPIEIRRLILSIRILVDRTLEETEDFPMPFVNPYLLKDVRESINAVSNKYHFGDPL